MDWETKVKQINLLINRLERLSSDSIWAHRASGIRGSLLGYLEELKLRNSQKIYGNMDLDMDQGYYVLEQAAKLILTKSRIKFSNPGTAIDLGEIKSENKISPD